MPSLEFKFACPECAQPLRAELGMVGEVIACPACQAKVLVPKPLSKDPPPVPAPPPLDIRDRLKGPAPAPKRPAPPRAAPAPKPTPSPPKPATPSSAVARTVPPSRGMAPEKESSHTVVMIIMLVIGEAIGYVAGVNLPIPALRFTSPPAAAAPRVDAETAYGATPVTRMDLRHPRPVDPLPLARPLAPDEP